MSKRSERREAERLTRKLAYKELRQQRSQNSGTQTESSQTAAVIANVTSPLPFDTEIPDPTPDSCQRTPNEQSSPQPDLETAALSTEESQPISEAQLNANQANAQFSTGPTTEAGKATSSRNALKHGLTSQTVVLPDEDPNQYKQDLQSHTQIHQPATEEELRLVQTVVDCHWRLDRIGRLETAILLKGHIECAHNYKHQPEYKDQPEIHRGRLIHADAYLKYERQIRNLNIQEARLRRTMEKAQAELKNLKAARRQREMAEIQAQRQADKAAAPESKPNGFDFSSRPKPAASTPPLKRRAA